jgi:hypothetical protein
MIIFVDGPVPLSSIAGTAGVDDTDTEEDIITIYESGTLIYPLSEILVNRACVLITIVLRHHPSVR